MTWEGVATATGYDVVRGDLVALRATLGDFAEAIGDCLVADVPAPGADDGEAPLQDGGFWYLVRAVNCTGPGSYDGDAPPQSGTRDGEIGVSGHACP